MAKLNLTEALSQDLNQKKEQEKIVKEPIKKISKPEPAPKKVETTRLDDDVVGSRNDSIQNYALRLPKDFYKALKLYCDQNDTTVNPLIYNKLRDALENDPDFKAAYKFINK